MTYEVEFAAEPIHGEIAHQLFKRVNADDVIFLWYQHVAPGKAFGLIDHCTRPSGARDAGRCFA